jgi:hypothetical protein
MASLISCTSMTLWVTLPGTPDAQAVRVDPERSFCSLEKRCLPRLASADASYNCCPALRGGKFKRQNSGFVRNVQVQA